jgi:hypothetical protein
MDSSMQAHGPNRESAQDPRSLPFLEAGQAPLLYRTDWPGLIPELVRQNTDCTLTNDHRLHADCGDADPQLPTSPNDQSMSDPMQIQMYRNSDASTDFNYVPAHNPMSVAGRRLPTQSSSSMDAYDEEHLQKRAKNNQAVKKSRAKTKQRVEDLEEKCKVKKEEHQDLKERLQKIELALVIQRSNNEHMMKVINVSQPKGTIEKSCDHCHT